MNNHSRHPWYVVYTYWIIKNIFGPVVRLIWVRNVYGLHNIPKTGPAIVTFNHQSYFDFLCFIAVCPRQVHFLSAEKFFTHIIWKHFMRFTGQIKVHRSEHDKHILHSTVNDHLRNNKIVGIFPEGTRSHLQTYMLHAFTGIAKFATHANVPIIPIGILGAYEVWSRHDKVPKFKKIIDFNIGIPMHFNHYDSSSLTDKEYRDITDQVMIQISKLSGKKYVHIGKLHRDKLNG